MSTEPVASLVIRPAARGYVYEARYCPPAQVPLTSMSGRATLDDTVAAGTEALVLLMTEDADRRAANSAFMDGREAEYERHVAAGRLGQHIGRLDYLGMTQAEYDDWKRTGIVPRRVLSIWRRA